MYLVCRPCAPLFPYTTLFRSSEGRELHRRDAAPGRARRLPDHAALDHLRARRARADRGRGRPHRLLHGAARGRRRPARGRADADSADRKSTRLNSSHRCISYAVRVLHSFPTRRSSDLARVVSYIDETLLPDEHVVYRTTLHWIIFARAGLVLIAGVAVLIAFYTVPLAGAAVLLVGVLMLIPQIGRAHV